MKRLHLYLGLLFITMSCEKTLLPEEPGQDPLSNFNTLHQTIGDRYSFFEYKQIDWEALGQQYRRNIYSNMTDDSLFAVMDALLYQLRDGHVNLISPFNLNRNWEWYLNSPDNYNEDAVERFYLGDEYRIAGGFTYALLEDSIGYMHYGSFSSTFSGETLDAIFKYFENTKGLILDLRHNGGGSLNNTFRLAGRFTNETKTALIQDEKTGPGPQDFGNTLQYSIQPQGKNHYLKPVVLLTNARCYSATNTFTALTKSLDQFLHVGDTTGGGGGIPADYELPNGWNYRFSVSRSFLPNGFNIEHGLPPDTAFDLDPTELASGKDGYIDYALSTLR